MLSHSKARLRNAVDDGVNGLGGTYRREGCSVVPAALVAVTAAAASDTNIPDTSAGNKASPSRNSGRYDPYIRGLHSSTFRLNLSAFCGIGGTFRGFLGGV